MSKYPNKYFNDKKCRMCGTVFTPIAPSHMYCCNKCSERAYQDRYLTRMYDMSLDEYETMLEKQGSRCKICGSEGFLMADHHKMKLVVDHDHSTGEVRGLLCHNCNRALGLLQDSADIVHKAMEYLKEGSETIRKEYA